MRISDWSSDVCSSDLLVNCAGIAPAERIVGRNGPMPLESFRRVIDINLIGTFNLLRLAAAEMSGLDPDPDGQRGVVVSTASVAAFEGQVGQARSEEHTSELQSLMRISYAAFCLKKKS